MKAKRKQKESPTKRQREAEARRLEESFAANLARFAEGQRTFRPTGRAPRIICVKCGRGPSDGIELHLPNKRVRDRELLCGDCAPALAVKPKPKRKAKEKPFALAPEAAAAPVEGEVPLPFEGEGA